MRASLIALAVALTPAAAVAQIANFSQMSPPMPPQQSTGAPPVGDTHHLSIPDPYARKLAFLRNRILWTQARDGGRLTPDHAAALERQLDALNRGAEGLRRN